MLISLSGINYVLGKALLFSDANFSVNATDRIALVGRNGSGKSTLLKMIVGQIDIDTGTRVVSANTRILLVKQELPDDDKTPLEYLKESDEELTQLAEKIETTDDISQIGSLYDLLESIETERYGKEATLVLLGLGISVEQQGKPMRELSGGIRMRIALASALLQSPDLLLLDEPTNHLDLASIIWLTEYLKKYPKPFVMVSHDRALLTAVINTTYHLQNGRLTRYNGDFNTCLEQRSFTEEESKRVNVNTDKKVAQQQKFVDTHKSDPKWAKIARTRERNIVKMENDRPPIHLEAPPIPITFKPCETLHDPIFRAENCSISYGKNPVLSKVSFSIQTHSRIGILGRNGEGKSTLIRMIMNDKVTVRGMKKEDPKLRIGYFSQEQSDTLQQELTALAQLKAVMQRESETEVLAHFIRFGFTREQMTCLVKNLSGGEKTRLSFAMIAAKAPQLIIMDEPTNHLDFETKQSLIAAIKNFNGAVVLVSHDWELLENTMSNYWLIAKGAVKHFDEGLEHYKRAILRQIQAAMHSNSEVQGTSSNIGVFSGSAKLPNVKFLVASEEKAFSKR